MPVTREYAEYCVNLTYADVPEEVLTYAKQLLLDTVGIAIGARSKIESSDSFVHGIRNLNETGSGATVLATGETLAPEYAALLNGALAHSLDYDDTHRSASLHPGATVIPAALAVAESENVGGEQLLTGIIAGYEVVCRLGRSINPSAHYERGFHATSTCGVFGATAAAATIRDLDAQEIKAVFGLNGSQASGSLQFLENGGWNKRAHPGLAAHSALVALELGVEGFFAASEPIEGENGFFHGYTEDPKPEAATADLGETYELLDTALKPYPCCRYMHKAMDLLLDIDEDEHVDLKDVQSITIELPTTGANVVRSPKGEYPESLVDAQFSMPFGAALVLIERDARLDSFLKLLNHPYDETFRRLFDGTTVTSTDEIDDAYPEKWPARVTVVTDKVRYTRYGEYARGEPENPMTWEEIIRKFDELSSGLTSTTRETVRDRIQNIEDYTAAELFEPLTGRVGSVNGSPE